MFEVAFRQALRGLLRRPAVGALAMVSLALGIFGAAYMCALFREVLLEPLPLPRSSELVAVALQDRGELRQRLPGEEFDALQQAVAGEVQLTARQYFRFSLEKAGTATRSVWTARVLPGYFSILQIPPLLGRHLQPGDSREHIRPILISQSLWMSELGGDPDVLGRRLNLHGRESEIVGVMPARANLLDRKTSVWSALSENPREWRDVMVIGRCRDARRLTAMADTLNAVHQAYLERSGDRRYSGRLAVLPLKDFVLDGILRHHEPVRSSINLLLALTGALFLMGCTNLSNVMLVQVNLRRSEFALRTALGASRRAVVGQLLLESLVLALLAGVLGILIGFAVQSYLNTYIPTWLREQYGLDGAVPDIWATLGLIVISAAACTALPGWLLSRDRNLAGDVGGGARGTLRAGVYSRVLLVGETSIATVLLLAATACAVHHWRLVNAPLGYDPNQILKVHVKYDDQLTWKPDEQGVEGFVNLNPTLRLVNEDLLSRLSRLPGVAGVARIREWDCGGAFHYFLRHDQTVSSYEDLPPPDDPAALTTCLRVVSPSFFQTMGIGLKEGRFFEPDDTRAGAPVIVIDQTMARRYWPDRSPVGERIRILLATLAEPDALGSAEIIGVAEPIRSQMGEPYVPTAYLLFSSYPTGSQLAAVVNTLSALLVRTEGDPSGLGRSVQEGIGEVSPQITVTEMGPLQEALRQPHRKLDFYHVVLLVLATMALILCASGVYGLTGFIVSSRTREFGIRTALGASRISILWAAVGGNLPVVAVGVGSGLLISVNSGNFLVGVASGLTKPTAAESALIAFGLTLLILSASALATRAAFRFEPARLLQEAE